MQTAVEVVTLAGADHQRAPSQQQGRVNKQRVRTARLEAIM
jgi:hypothetical protein